MVTILAVLAIGLPLAASLLDPHGVSADPQFVAAGDRDYRLGAASPAIDAALPLAGSAKMWWMVSRILASPSVGLLVAEPETGLA